MARRSGDSSPGSGTAGVVRIRLNVSESTETVMNRSCSGTLPAGYGVREHRHGQPPTARAGPVAGPGHQAIPALFRPSRFIAICVGHFAPVRNPCQHAKRNQRPEPST
jgi:hypothetical protein